MSEYIILFAVFISSFIYGLIGFGDALILIPILTLFINIQSAVVLVNFWGVVPSLLNLIHYFKFIDKKFFIRGVITGIPGVLVGTLLIVILPLRWIELTLGLFVLVYSTLNMVKYLSKKKHGEKKIEKFDDLKLPNSVLIVGGFSYGFFGALIGAAGPINIALLENTGHYREEFIGNFAAISTVFGLIRIPIYLTQQIFPTEYLLAFFIAIPVIFFATKIGHWITPKIPVQSFQLIIHIMLFISSIRTILMTTIFYE
ncbi:sulfite exporter TauE/SafE family protein [Promethearchaeum syntrophicum]|uniref:Probable membrane transporter protein n=1 Tax=Promethearchaeum syntrophicum TaxID=2594042 RepID=A0A5B9D9W0_9ARCH|nr:sulfite exporter TauE/SafE family protein [Candidatus Prometheoarchaeum syntrophicum]QEE15801.1 Sulfite exporter TauE/SafE [Candidatus Prometheoarchaeum syntrophicum]